MGGRHGALLNGILVGLFQAIVLHLESLPLFRQSGGLCGSQIIPLYSCLWGSRTPRAAPQQSDVTAGSKGWRSVTTQAAKWRSSK